MASGRFSIGGGDRKKPLPRLVLVGEPGIGKTTFAASAKDVVLIPTEDGALGLDVPMVPNDGKCRGWDDFMRAIDVVLDEEHSFKWLAVDTITAAVALRSEKMMKEKFKGDAVEFNRFSSGPKAVGMELTEVLNLLGLIQQKRNMGVILLAHIGTQRSANALGPDFQKFAAEMHSTAWERVRAWADQVGFAMRDQTVMTMGDERKHKAVSDNNARRYIRFEGGPGIDAKARAGYEMPDEILLDWSEYETHLGDDPVEIFIQKNLGLLDKATNELVEHVSDMLGGSINNESLKAIGLARLQKMHNWLTTKVGE